ncbi:MAG: O-methyltransferase, partial [Gammaproteobacteria bacterium]|nr:O-methyltransferase [Gammaproteobacteria bacterium]
TCERDKRWWPIAADAFEKSGVSSQVHQEKCHAIESLQNWLNLDTPPVFDFIFIDADKSSIPVYVDACLPLLSPQGLLIIDNVWWQGKVLNSDDHQKRAEVLRQFNADLAKDARLDVVMLPISDGISMIRKKAFL